MKSFRKKAIIFSLLIACALTVWKKQEKENISLKNTTNSPWLHYSKDEKGNLKVNTPEQIGIASNTEETNVSSNSRGPASVNSDHHETGVISKGPSEKQVTFWNTAGSDKEKKELSELDFQNRYDEKWQDLLAKNLLQFQPKETEIFILPIKSIIKILDDNKAMFMEEVVINVKTDKGRSSFKALIDSENGKVAETWDNSMIDENSARKPAQAITPSGTL